MSKTYNQIASKLSKKDVNGHTVTMKASGCGVCALAAIAYNIETSYTLSKVWSYMVSKGYTIREGTTRTGMTECIEHYGMQSDYYSPAYSGTKFDNLMSALKKCATEKRWGILLMYGKAKGGTSDYWTHGGHFIAVTDFDPDRGFYVRDSANGRTGWHPKKEFEGCIVAGWVITPADATSKVTTVVKKVTSSVSKKVYNAKCTAKAGVNIRKKTTKNGKTTYADTGKNVGFGKNVLVKKKSAGTMTLNGVKYTMMQVTYGTTTGYVAQKYFSF